MFFVKRYAVVTKNQQTFIAPTAVLYPLKDTAGPQDGQ
jgi:hypothetical protein